MNGARDRDLSKAESHPDTQVGLGSRGTPQPGRIGDPLYLYLKRVTWLAQGCLKLGGPAGQFGK